MTNNNKTMVIVEDEPDLNETYSEWFEHNGFDIVGNAKNGLEAIQIIKEKKPQYVILDTMMQDYDGYYVMKQLKKLHSDSKVIIITGCTECNYEGKEIIGIFRKPCKLDRVKKAIKTFEENSQVLV
jgi:DNA-binding NtrC family response regulator